MTSRMLPPQEINYLIVADTRMREVVKTLKEFDHPPDRLISIITSWLKTHALYPAFDDQA